MERIKTTPELAQQILKTGNRKIVCSYGKKVEWINLNNQTLFSGSNGNGSMKNLEDVEVFICVPKKAKTVY
jgi:hypothetical protein